MLPIIPHNEVIDNPQSDDRIFLFNGQNIALINDKTPLWSEISHLNLQPKSFYFFAEENQQRCILVESDFDISEEPLFTSKFLRLFLLEAGEAQACLPLLASHLHYWRTTHQFCGVCQQKMQDKNDERARICQSCGFVAYPRISPCIIVVISNGKKILLARSPHFPSEVYSALAGFVEPGESLEQAVHREVKEEVGINIKDIRYFGSQPWPFPDSLMIAFTAEYESGSIIIDGKEIEDAAWFDPDKLPKLPSSYSISRRLIESVLPN